MSVLEDAARAYVAARLAIEHAEPADMTVRVVEVDSAWGRLLDASGLRFVAQDASCVPYTETRRSAT